MAEYKREYCEPIDWSKDKDEVILGKIKLRIDDSKDLLEAKKKQYNESELYLKGETQKIDGNRPRTIANIIFPIVRNMSGLITDPKPNPGVKIVKINKDIPKEKVQELMETAERLEESLDDWWEDYQMQTKLQRIIFSTNTLGDFYIMPFFNTNMGDVDIHFMHPKLVHLDPNADGIDTSEYAAVDLYKTRKWLVQRFGEKVLKNDKITFHDYTEAMLSEVGTSEYKDTESAKMKSVAHIILYMEPEHFVYMCGDTILEKGDNPTWATSEKDQKDKLMLEVKRDYLEEKGKFNRAMDVTLTSIKSLFGIDGETELEKRQSAAVDAYTPSKNYFKFARIPLIQFDTYRLAGEKYSIAPMKLSIPMIDNHNEKKEAVSRNSKTLAEPTIYVHGGMLTEDDAAKLKKRSDKPIRVPLPTAQPINAAIKEVNGQSLPPQFFNDIEDDRRMLDNIWGHHEVSKGSSDPNNQTKGGILALQEADQTPVRFLVRNLESSLSELFAWVVQIRKINKMSIMTGEAEDQTSLDYSEIGEHHQVFVKAGSMMPVSREQQRQDAMDMYLKGAMDPLTLFERLNDPDPEQSAKRLQAWITQKQLLTNDMEDQQQRVAEKIQAILQNNFEAVKVQPDDDPQIHHDMLVLALKQNLFKSPQQEQFVAQLITQYAQSAGQPIPGTKMPSEQAGNPQAAQSQAPQSQ